MKCFKKKMQSHLKKEETRKDGRNYFKLCITYYTVNESICYDQDCTKVLKKNLKT